MLHCLTTRCEVADPFSPRAQIFGRQFSRWQIFSVSLALFNRYPNYTTCEIAYFVKSISTWAFLSQSINSSVRHGWNVTGMRAYRYIKWYEHCTVHNRWVILEHFLCAIIHSDKSNECWSRHKYWYVNTHLVMFIHHFMYCRSGNGLWNRTRCTCLCSFRQC